MRTDSEIKQIALDILSGRIFHSQMCPRPEEIFTVFMPLGLMDGEARKTFLKDEPYLLFEYLDNAGPVSCNGMPIFMSFRHLNKIEYEKTKEYVEKLRTVIATVNLTKEKTDGADRGTINT